MLGLVENLKRTLINKAVEQSKIEISEVRKEYGTQRQMIRMEVEELHTKFQEEKRKLEAEMDFIRTKLIDTKELEGKKIEVIGEARSALKQEMRDMHEQWIVERGEVGKLLREEIIHERKKFEASLTELKETSPKTVYLEGFRDGFKSFCDHARALWEGETQRRIAEAVQVENSRHATVLENHKKRVSHAASPQVVKVYDDLVKKLDTVQSLGPSNVIPEIKAQIKILQPLLKVKENGR